MSSFPGDSGTPCETNAKFVFAIFEQLNIFPTAEYTFHARLISVKDLSEDTPRLFVYVNDIILLDAFGNYARPVFVITRVEPMIFLAMFRRCFA